MPKTRMRSTFSFKKLANKLDNIVIADLNVVGNRINKAIQDGIDSGKDQHISYIHEKQYFKYFLTTKASAIIIQSDHDLPSSGKTVIKVNNAANAFSKLISLFHNDNMFVPFISNSALLS